MCPLKWPNPLNRASSSVIQKDCRPLSAAIHARLCASQEPRLPQLHSTFLQAAKTVGPTMRPDHSSSVPGKSALAPRLTEHRTDLDNTGLSTESKAAFKRAVPHLWLTSALCTTMIIWQMSSSCHCQPFDRLQIWWHSMLAVQSFAILLNFHLQC